MSEKLDFYEVNVDYVKYLKQFDSRIPNVEYQNRNKFLCGTLFKINGLNYFAPVSSFNIKQSSNYVIEVGNVPARSAFLEIKDDKYYLLFPSYLVEYDIQGKKSKTYNLKDLGIENAVLITAQ